jgi:NADH-ubiquinone oxidoreductase chain 5
MSGLLIIAIIGGSFLNWLIFSSYYIICIPFFLKIFTLIVCIIGGFTGYLIRNVKIFFLNKSLKFYFFSFINSSIWFIPLISTTGIILFPLKLGGLSLKNFDQGWSEMFGGQNLYNNIKNGSIINQFIQNNNLKIYLFIFVFWVIFLIIIIFI